MVQPKKPPISLRIPDATRTAVEQYASEKGLARNAAYVELLERGLVAATSIIVPAPPPAQLTPTRKATIKAATEAHQTPNAILRAARPTSAPKFRGMTASGEPLPERKPLQKKPK